MCLGGWYNLLFQNIISCLVSFTLMLFIILYIRKKKWKADKIKLIFMVMGYILAAILFLLTIFELSVFQNLRVYNYKIIRIVDNTIFLLFLFIVASCIIINLRKK